MSQHTTPDASTKGEDAKDANAHKDGGPMPTEAEEQAAERNEPVDPAVAKAVQEQYERGAKNQGEGRTP